MLKRRISAFCAAAVMSVAAFAQQAAATLTEQQTDSLNRAVAVVIAGSLDPVIANLQANGLPVDRADVGRYVAEIMGGKDFGLTVTDANAYVETLIRQNTSLSPESQQAFVEKAAAQPGAITTPSGLVFNVVVEGEGVHPTLDDQVFVKYIGRFYDGTVFDDTGDETVTFDLHSEIPGFVEGLQLMKPGGTYRLVIPASLAYGAEGIPGIIPGNAALDFTVTLEAIKAGSTN